MPITRTPIIDDDGSGTSGTVIDNAWKQEFYNQIDAQAAGLTPSYAFFTLADASGAGLAISNTQGLYARIGRVIHVWCQPIYPATASSAPAVLGYLPAPNTGVPAGGFTAYGIGSLWFIAGGGSTFMPLNPTTGAQRTNADMSGMAPVIVLTYLAA